MITVKILGLSGSIRHGNTEILVKEALQAAATLPGVETEYLSLADLKVTYGCNASYACWYKPRLKDPCRCYSSAARHDDVNMILEKMMEADGIIIGAPSYWGGIPMQLKGVIDRSMAIEMGFHLRNKVGAAIAVAAERHGGHEGVVDDLHRWMFIHDMVICGVGPERPATSIGGHQGAMAIQGFPYPVHSDQPGEKTAVTQDDIGLSATRALGKRVAELAKIVKAGLGHVPDDELGWRRGAVGSQVFDRAEAAKGEGQALDGQAVTK